MKALILMLAIGLAACNGTKKTGQVNVKSPNSFMRVNMEKDREGDPSYTVEVNTDEDYDDCMREFQDTEGAPGHCQEEADRAEAKALATAGRIIGAPLDQGGAGLNPNDPIQQGYAQARGEMQRTQWGTQMYLPMSPLAPPAQPAPAANAQKLDDTAEALKTTIRRVKDHEDRLKQIEGGK